MRRFLVIVLALLALGLPAAPAFAAGPGSIYVTISASPPITAVGQPMAVQLHIHVVGAQNFMLLSSYPIVATNTSSGQSVTATARPIADAVRTYGATVAFPSPGIWLVTSPPFANDPGDSMAVAVIGTDLAPGAW